MMLYNCPAYITLHYLFIYLLTYIIHTDCFECMNRDGLVQFEMVPHG